jgi:membrane protein implicated in regulation of membrane protease activity
MSPADDRAPPAGGGRGLGILVEDALILASALALGVCAFRVPLGLSGWPTAAILGATLAVMAVVFVRRIRRLIRQRQERAGGAGGARKDGTHAD